MPEDREECIARRAPGLDFPVIGIGASAGGLEAVSEMFRTVEPGTGMSFVLIQHLDPNHQSMMAELLSRKTDLNVQQVENGETLEVDTLYVIPPGHALSIEDGRFVLSDFDEPRGLRRPIDTFFASLGRAQGHMSASVVLSGTGADGSTGMRAVKDAGGICVAQKPSEARYDGMPQAVTSTGLIDFTLSARDIVPRLQGFFERRLEVGVAGKSAEISDRIDEICGVLRESTGHDFSGYKHTSLARRVERRMQVIEMHSVEDYLDRLRTEDTECSMLFQDLLINVTSFFRDPLHFERLRKQVIEPLMTGSEPRAEIRVWVPGCSSGQEAYSIAMLFDEMNARLDRPRAVQIFATDIDPRMVAIAREGRYSASSLNDIPERIREVCTIGLDGQFQITPRVRDMVRFSIHSMIKDPPFSKLDLISCRNLLIYMGDEVQHALVPLMHFALRPGRFLFLGPSENVTRREDLFELVDHKARIFRATERPSRYPVSLPLGRGGRKRREHDLSLPRERDFPERQGRETVRGTLLDLYAPPFVRIDADDRIVESSGELGPFLKSRPSDDVDVGQLARDGLRETLGQLLSQARDDRARRALRDVEIQSPFGSQTADVIAHPMVDGSIALIFIARDRFRADLKDDVVTPADGDQRIAQLEDELQATRFRLKGTVEEVETANEELKSSNEEMMSMNEELQSANEELTTANEELKNKVDELAVANADLDNFMQSAGVGIVVTDRKLRIRHTTDAVRAILPLVRSADRPSLHSIDHDLDDVDLARLAETVISTGEPVQQMVTSQRRRSTYQMRILPYQSAESGIAGVTLTFNDVTALDVLERDLSIKSERLSLALKAAQMGVFEYDIPRQQVIIDDRVAEMLKIPDTNSPELTLVFERIHPEDREETRRSFTEAVEGGQYEAEFRVEFEDKSVRWLRGMGSHVVTADGEKVLGVNFDITDEREAVEAKDLLVKEMSHRVKNLFAVLEALVRRAPKASDEVQDFARTLEERIAALGRAYDLTRAEFIEGNLDLRVLLEMILSPHADDGRVTLSGDRLPISVRSITPLGLIFHEMATNALKYGALSVGDGTLDVSWSATDDGGIRLEWTERGIDVEGLSFEPGFGTRLIDISVRQMQGRHERSLNPSGIHDLFVFGHM